MKCPSCNFEGDFDTKKPFPLVFTIFQQLREDYIASRTSVCPKCRTEILAPSRFPQTNFGWKGMTLAIAIPLAIIGYLVYRFMLR